MSDLREHVVDLAIDAGDIDAELAGELAPIAEDVLVDDRLAHAGVELRRGQRRRARRRVEHRFERAVAVEVVGVARRGGVGAAERRHAVPPALQLFVDARERAAQHVLRVGGHADTRSRARGPISVLDCREKPRCES